MTNTRSQAGLWIGVRGTPTIIRNGHKLRGYDAGFIGEWLETALRRSASSGRGGSASAPSAREAVR
jgi:hypothetical protein